VERLRLEILRVRAQGYAVLEQQLQAGVRGIALLVRDHQDEVVGALSLSLPIGAATAAEEVKRVLTTMQESVQVLHGLL
jgi:IclR family pca regulon transcriptional regulator